MTKKKTTVVLPLKRVFLYSSLKLEDIGSDKSPEEVKDFYSAHYPELINATIKGPVVENDCEVWRFQAVKGTKG